MAGSLDIANPYYNIYTRPGTQISSHGEGRTVNIQETELVHPSHADGLVDKGDPVAFWDGVGIAMKSAELATDIIPVDTEGIWKLTVENTGLNNFGTIRVGQVLFIDAAGRVYDDWVTSFAIFGYAMEAIDSVRTDIIAVKVHWMHPYWFYDPVTGGP